MSVALQGSFPSAPGVPTSPPPPAPIVTRAVPGLLAILLAIGVYTNLPLTLGHTGIPMASALPWMMLLLPFVYRRLLSRTFVRIVMIDLIAFAFSLFAPDMADYFAIRVVAAGQFLFSLAVGYTVYCVVQTLSRDQIARFMLGFAIIVMLLCVIEIATPLKAIVGAYSGLYGGSGITQSVLDRDAAMGGYRPKLFTAETSYVAMALSYALSCYAWSSRNPMKHGIALCLLGLSFAILRSPTVLGALLPLTLNFIVDASRSRRVRNATVVFIPMILFAAMAGTILFGDRVADAVQHRIDGAQSGSDYSVTYRTYGSWAAGIAVANQYPLFGVGMAGYDIVRQTIIDTELHFGVPPQAVDDEWRMSLNNAPANALVVFGYFGSILMVALCLFGLRRLSLGYSATFAAMILILSLSDGAIYSPRFVTYLFLFAAVARLLNEDEARTRAADAEAWHALHSEGVDEADTVTMVSRS